MNLRPAVAADADVLAALEQQLFGADAWSPATVRSDVAASAVPGADRLLLVAEDSGDVHGYVLTARAGEVVELHRIGVRPCGRRRGTGRLLLAAAVERAAADGAERVLLEVSAANDAALRLYAGAGFTELARRARYYRDGADALVLARALVDVPVTHGLENGRVPGADPGAATRGDDRG